MARLPLHDTSGPNPPRTPPATSRVADAEKSGTKQLVADPSLSFVTSARENSHNRHVAADPSLHSVALEKPKKKSSKSAARVGRFIGGLLCRSSSNTIKDEERSEEIKQQDEEQVGSQTEALTDTERKSDQDPNEEHDADVSVHAAIVLQAVFRGYQRRNTTRKRLVIVREQHNRAATLVQALFRGYRQRYYFKISKLQKELHTIYHLKHRQLKKLAQRTKACKKSEKSQLDFHYNKNTRSLQRNTRIVPYLFREAQVQLQQNMSLAETEADITALEESHMALKTLAHLYLESMEDVNGIWEVLKAQWMAPKKPRPRRTFGPDGKAKRILRQVITRDEDLSTNIPVYVRKDSDKPSNEEKLIPLDFLNMNTYLETMKPFSDEDTARAMDSVQRLVSDNILN
jgi:hypothetical protein